MKSSFLAVFFFGVAVAACAGGETSPNSDGGAGGEEVVTSNNSSSSSGMGGAGGNGTGGMGGAGGGGPMFPADKLGQVCNSPAECPLGYICAKFDMAAPSGFCTLTCGGPVDMQTCGAGNGFPGPGQGACAIAGKDPQGNTTPICAILCGAQFNLPDACPTMLTCQDKVGANGMPGTDGKNDLCLP